MKSISPKPSTFHHHTRCICLALLFVAGLGMGPVRGEEFTATEGEALRAREGQEATVTGLVSRVGVGPSGVMHFINFRNVPKGGFVVVLKKDNILAFTEKFGADFPFNLTGKSLRVKGVVGLYENTPQIELTSPEQLELQE